MGKYLKQGFVRELEWNYAREEISHSKMVELMEEECIKNFTEEMKKDKNKPVTKEPTLHWDSLPTPNELNKMKRNE